MIFSIQDYIISGKEKLIYLLTHSGIIHHIYSKNEINDYINVGKSAVKVLDKIATYTKVSWIKETPVNYTLNGISNQKIDKLLTISEKVSLI